MNPIASILNSYPLMVLDGALATELESRGCDLRDPLWSAKVLIEAPHLIKQVHAEYLKAGADCVTTATYQATFEGFERRGLTNEEAADLMRLAVQLAVEARDECWDDPSNRLGRPRPLVAASIGSYGAFLADGSEYSGDYNLTKRALMNFHRPRMSVLADTQADILACETIPCLIEAQALAELLTEFPQCTAWISFSARDGKHLCHGESLAESVATLDQYNQIAAVGVNCTAPRYIPDLVRAAGAATHKPIVVYPNSGETYCVDDRTWQGGEEVDMYAVQAQTWFAAGAQIIGGCCRTTPAQIRAIAEWARRNVK